MRAGLWASASKYQKRKVIDQNRLWRMKNRARALFNMAKSGAKSRGLDFKITFEDLPVVPNFCPVFPWIKLCWHSGEYQRKQGQSKRFKDSPSLDRIDNNKGYVKGNVRWISWRANDLKSNATKKELYFLLKDAR